MLITDKKIIALDVETTGINPLADCIRAIALFDGEKEVFLDTSKVCKEEIAEWFKSNQHKTFVAHYAKFDASFIYAEYGVLLRNLWCTMLASQILNNGKPFEHSLKANLLHYLGVRLTDDKKKMQLSFLSNEELTDEQYEYALEDVRHLLRLKEEQEKYIEEYALQHIVRLENRLTPVLVHMEHHGVLVDKKGWSSQLDFFDSEMRRYERLMDGELRRLREDNPAIPSSYTKPRTTQVLVQTSLFGNGVEVSNENLGNVNYSSDKQVKDIFRKLSLPLPTNKYGRESVDENSLNTYFNEHPDSILKIFSNYLFKYREYAKLKSTYGSKFLSLLDEDRYIHTNYTQTKTATGRLSSTKPNLQNIPKPSKEYNLRQYFIAKGGYKIITYDLSGAEIRIAASFSQDPLLLASLNEGLDLHSELASQTYTIMCKEPIKISKSKKPFYVKGIEFIPSECRTLHKSILFAFFYSAGANRIYQVLAPHLNLLVESQEERMQICRDVLKALEIRMPKLTAFLKSKIRLATTERMLGKERTMYLRANKLGRIRRFKEDAYGEASNFCIQATNADSLKIAMIRIFEWIMEESLDARIVLNVHDEVSVEAKECIAEYVEKKQKYVLQNSLDYFLDGVSAESEGSISDSW